MSNTDILIIDDEIQIREVLRTVLERVGYTVSEAENGVQGLEVYGQGGIDLVVTDIIMPQKGGIDTIMDLRRDFPAGRHRLRIEHGEFEGASRGVALDHSVVAGRGQ